MENKKIYPKFVEKIPHELKDGVLYICLRFNVIVHKCACGCGEKTVTPIDRKYGWILEYDGESVTLKPSIGNFNIKCKSHYFITRNKIEWLSDNLEPRHKKWYQIVSSKIRNFFAK